MVVTSGGGPPESSSEFASSASSGGVFLSSQLTKGFNKRHETREAIIAPRGSLKNVT